MKIKIKICGNLFFENSLMVASFHPDYMGWIFSPFSPRRINPYSAEKTILHIRNTFPSIKHVAVFAGNSVGDIAKIVGKGSFFDCIQIVEGAGFFQDLRRHIGVASGLDLIPAVRVRKNITDMDLVRFGRVPFFVFDTYVKGQPGGTGKLLNTENIKQITRPYLLAGGLNSENVAGILESFGKKLPLGVDVSSGIEDSPGLKNRELVELFIKRVKEAERSV